jgi:hypothetical protein
MLISVDGARHYGVSSSRGTQRLMSRMGAIIRATERGAMPALQLVYEDVEALVIRREPVHQGSYPGELTDDQVAYLREQAELRRRRWMEHSRET